MESLRQRDAARVQGKPADGGTRGRRRTGICFPLWREGDAKRSLLRERRRIGREASEQADLIASSLKREAELLSKRGGTDAKTRNQPAV